MIVKNNEAMNDLHQGTAYAQNVSSPSNEYTPLDDGSSQQPSYEAQSPFTPYKPLTDKNSNTSDLETETHFQMKKV